MNRPKGYSASIRENGTIYGTYLNRAGWADGTKKWSVTLKNPAGKTLAFQYHTGPLVKEKPTFNDVVQALITDGLFYEEYPDLVDFALETGQDPEDPEAIRGFKICKSYSERMRVFFGNDFDAICEATAE